VKGSLYEVCRLGADGCNKDGMRTMGQAAVSCTDRKPPGSCRGAPSDMFMVIGAIFYFILGDHLVETLLEFSTIFEELSGLKKDVEMDDLA
jgi:hypothetical protein